MGSSCGESMVDFDSQDSTANNEEKIFVSVRLRPLNERELSKNDVSEWESINSTTILFKNALHERSMLPTAYVFDRVFGYDSPTRRVYDEAAKKIALSVLNGMNSTIFAYGQTSSGKTYTMSGITDYAIDDIFDYINKHSERDFVLRFSAMEIYNEAVRDLLVIDGPPLRLLDDPERGTVVDKLTEVMVSDADHLRELLSICEEQRQSGETTLNEVSSRSHQILRLTVESEARGYHASDSSSLLTASVSFVDLAGSERASQTLSAGTRLKEGCHINRSLLTLGTVIRKLSKGRNAHIPYRDSKLTRILQNSLGGNARTAIICTMSPAHSHLEQSRNTLLFASCAKQVSTNAQVNVVMSEKALVKNLQKELARLEGELRKVSSVSSNSVSSPALREKELLIQKMDKEIKELTHQRDLAQSRVEEMLQSASASKSWVDMHRYERGSWASEYALSEASDSFDPYKSDVASRASHLSERYEGLGSCRIEDQFPQSNNEEQFLSDDTSPGMYIDKFFGPDPSQGWEKTTTQENNNETEDIDIDDVTTGNAVSSAQSSERKDDHISSAPSPRKGELRVSEQSLLSPDNDVVSSTTSPKKDDQVSDHESPCSSETGSSEASSNVTRSKSCAAILTTVTNSPSSEFLEGHDSNNTPEGESDNRDKTLADHSETVAEKTSDFPDDEDNTDKQNDLVPEKELHYEVVERSKSSKEVEGDLVRTESSIIEQKTANEPEETVADSSDKTQEAKQSPASDWQAEFEKQKKAIIELWEACHTPLVHRTYFFLLFKGDPSDAVYLEVELRRLSFLKNTMHGVGVGKDDQLSKQASSAKALNREREMLCKQMLKKYSTKERDALFQKWGIDLKSKQRRLQLCRRLWADPTNTEHINESAAMVAKLVGFKEPGLAHKEMFGLSILPASRSFSWIRS